MSIFNDGSQTKEESRRTIIAVVLSTVIVSVGFMISNVLFPPAPVEQAKTQTTASQTVTSTGSQAASSVVTTLTPAAAPAAKQTAPVEAVAAPAVEETYTIDTD